MRSPTEHTLNYLKKIRAEARVVERWNPWAKRRHDLWGADILARQGMKLLAIQSTSGAHHADHVKTACANPDVQNWLVCGVAFEIWSWSRQGKAGKRKLWTPRVTQLICTNGKVRPM
jgi:hypothetical protein